LPLAGKPSRAGQADETNTVDLLKTSFKCDTQISSLTLTVNITEKNQKAAIYRVLENALHPAAPTKDNPSRSGISIDSFETGFTVSQNDKIGTRNLAVSCGISTTSKTLSLRWTW
jgi:hypothetical protein